MRQFRVLYREKGNPYGNPVASEAVELPDTPVSLVDILRAGTQKNGRTWYSVQDAEGKTLITLKQVRANIGRDNLARQRGEVRDEQF